MEMKMRKLAITILGALLIVAGSAVQIASASEHHAHKAHRAGPAVGEQFRNANNLVEGRVNTSCQNRESGNPYNEETDFEAWSAWRNAGGWDSHNDCW
jgi:hypothetical protein